MHENAQKFDWKTQSKVACEKGKKKKKGKVKKKLKNEKPKDVDEKTKFWFLRMPEQKCRKTRR